MSEEILRLVRGPRLLADLRGPADGPTLICVGGLHGNEPAGALGLSRFLRRFGPQLALEGRMVALVGNQQALERGVRYIDYDLNRSWYGEKVERLRRTSGPLETEEAEMRDLERELRKILAESEGRPVYFLDLHTTSGDGAAFANLDDALPNRQFALAFPVTLVVGIEEELAGTLANYLCDRDAITVGFESGQHDEPEAVDRAEAAIWVALEASGVIAAGNSRSSPSGGTCPEVAAARALLAEHRGELPNVVEVIHRHAIRPGDHFEMLPGFRNLQPIRAGQPLARNEHGHVVAPHDGLILMPLYQRQGDDGFFVARRVRPAWLKLSEFLRRRNLERYLHRLPGVERHPELREGFIIDRRWARWKAVQVFHLLGFRRHSSATARHLVMARRAHDR